MAIQQLGVLYFDLCGRLDRSRLASCAGQGRQGSALHISARRITEDGGDVNIETFVDSARRWLGIWPADIMDLHECGACKQAMAAEGRDDGPGERAAHLAACSSANREEAGLRGALTTYHTGHTALRTAVRLCAEDALGKDCVREEVPGLIRGSQERPGDVVLYPPGLSVAVDTTITHIQTATNMKLQADNPGKPVLDDERGKYNKYANAEFTSTTRFVPFAVDDFGHIGDSGWALLEQLAAYAAARRSGKESEAYVRTTLLQKWQHRIAHAVRTVVHRSVQDRLIASRRHLTERRLAAVI